MKAKSWMAGIAAAATLFASVIAPAGAMAEEATTPGASQTSTNCATNGNTITVKGTDADAFKTWNGKTSSSNRTFKVAKVADYKIDNGTSDGLVHLETVAASETIILKVMKELKSNDGTSLYQSKDLQGDPMNWLANTGQDSLIRKYADNPGVTGTVLEADKVSVDDTNNTMTLTMTEPGLYVIFDATQPKKQVKDTGDTTVDYSGFNNMLVGTPLEGCNVSNNTGVVDLTSEANAKTGSTTTTRGGFKFIKVGVGSDRTGLSGATFTVYSDENFTQILKDAKGVKVEATSVGEGGHVDFSGFKLNAGTYYLKETKVPDGYWSGSAAKLKVTMKKNSKGEIELESITDMNVPASGLLSYGEDNLWVYRNIKSITQLPLTGAMGMAILGVMAVLCIGGASIIIVRARKTKRSFAV
nr:SpaA isopeptide-forming pilin-related protein [Bifidobacterium catenulatum]